MLNLWVCAEVSRIISSVRHVHAHSLQSPWGESCTIRLHVKHVPFSPTILRKIKLNTIYNLLTKRPFSFCLSKRDFSKISHFFFAILIHFSQEMRKLVLPQSSLRPISEFLTNGRGVTFLLWPLVILN